MLKKLKLWFYKDLQDLLELTSKKDVLFNTEAWNAKVRSQETPGITGKFGLGVQNETRQRLIEFCQENALVITPSSSNTREDSTHGHYQMANTEIRLIIFFAAKDAKALYNQQKQDGELTVAQTMNSLLPNSDLKKVGKSTRPFRYDLNQIPYTVEVRNRFKGLDLIDRVPVELWTEVRDIVQETGIKTTPQK